MIHICLNKKSFHNFFHNFLRLQVFIDFYIDVIITHIIFLKKLFNSLNLKKKTIRKIVFYCSYKKNHHSSFLKTHIYICKYGTLAQLNKFECLTTF